MIKTTQPVAVDNRKKRISENKIMYAEITKVEVFKDKYVININEFVYDTLESTDMQGNPTTIEQKRPIVTIPRVRTKAQILDLIAILKDETQLTAYGLTQHIGVYETLNDVEQIYFLIEVAHFIENNRDLIRESTWEEHVETTTA